MSWYFVVLFAYALPYVYFWNEIGFGDWDVTTTYAQIAVWWWQQGDWNAAWNPFVCGGYPLFGNAQLPFFHPALPLFWLFGPALGLKLMVLAWMTAGFFLARTLFEKLEIDGELASLGAAAWVLNGFFIGHLGTMHGHFVCFFLVPGFFLGILNWIETAKLRHLAGLSALLLAAALHSYSFLVYFFPFVPLYFAFEMLVRRERVRNWLRLGIPLGTVLLCTLVVMGFYIYPVAKYLGEFPRATEPIFENPFKLFTFWFFPGSLWRMQWPIWEYQFFLGPVLFWFAVKGFRHVRNVPRRFLPLLGVAAVGAVLAMGSFRAFGSPVPSPFDLVREWVPLYSNVRVTSRFLIGGLLAVLLVALWALRDRKLSRGFLIAALLPSVLFLWENTYRVGFGHRWHAPKKPPLVMSSAFQWKSLEFPREQMYVTLNSETGIANCYDSVPIPRNETDVLQGPLVASLPDGITWERLGWGDLRFHTTAPLAAVTDVDIQFNHHRKWGVLPSISPESRIPAIVSAPFEKLRVRIPPGSHDFRLRFDDPDWPTGWKITLAGLAALVVSFLGTGLSGRYRW